MGPNPGRNYVRLRHEREDLNPDLLKPLVSFGPLSLIVRFQKAGQVVLYRDGAVGSISLIERESGQMALPMLVALARIARLAAR